MAQVNGALERGREGVFDAASSSIDTGADVGSIIGPAHGVIA